MSHYPTLDRRTVLKTTTALLGSGLAASTVAASGNSPPHARNNQAAIDISTSHYHDSGEHQFTLSTNEVPAGWRTMRLHNESGHTHFAYLAMLPQAAIDEAAARDVSVLTHYIERVTNPFQFFMDTMVPGKEPDPSDLYPDGEFFPAWFGEMTPAGGPGLTSPGQSSTTTVFLEPGQYIVECYVKDPTNDFHSYHGMLDLITVTGGEANVEPRSNLAISVSSAGIDAPEAVRPGRHVVAVEFQDQQLYPHLLGHDVHLVRLDDGTTAEDVSEWMNWMNPAGLVSDGTEPTTFLGGVETILTPGLLDGSETATAYVDVRLTPGTYAWVAEVPDPLGAELLTEFSVPGRD